MGCKKYTLFLCCVLAFIGMSFLPFQAMAQSIVGKIQDPNHSPISFASVRLENHNKGTVAGADGSYELEHVQANSYILKISATGYKTVRKSINVLENQTLTVDITLQIDTAKISTVYIRSTRKNTLDLRRMADVEGMAIYAGKKNEVILLDNVQGNLSANTSRQIFAKVPGMNIQENDAGGIQMSVSARGLNPSRMLEFNVRQNGYDIAADALGYPESYYTPPAFALKRIEVIRGAASLQYGPQFGGLINFVLKSKGEKPLEGELQATYGSYNFIALNASIGGSKGKFNYYGFVGKRRGDGWRKNTDFDITNGYLHVDCNVHKKVNIGLDYTGMLYTMQQPGGLTDAQFAQNPRQSFRNRNWFTASWNVLANTIDIQINARNKINIRNFMVLADRYSIGNLNPMTEADTGGYRNLQKDDYLNFGSEIRYMKDYNIRSRNNTLLTGVRIYRGSTHRMQGLGSAGSDANFSFNHPQQLEDSDFQFPSWNLAAFAENVFAITRNFSVTPGIRGEFIQTTSNGYYMSNGVRTNERKNRNRAFVLAGIGLAYKLKTTEVYANFSQNYSAVNFNDIRVNNPNLRVDPNLHDVKGFNADIGYRGTYKAILNFDISAYYINYSGRIGTITQYDDNFEIYQYRTNISNSRNIGAEVFVECNVLRIFKRTESKGILNVFVSAAYTDARYVNSQNKSLEGKFVELAPKYIVRTGISYKIKGFAAQFQYAYTTKQFTDANNTLQSANGITGIIPAYAIADLSASYEFKKIKLSAGCNNLLNATYFTRRANGYPGPGILPSDPRNFYVTLGVKL